MQLAQPAWCNTSLWCSTGQCSEHHHFLGLCSAGKGCMGKDCMGKDFTGKDCMGKDCIGKDCTGKDRSSCLDPSHQLSSSRGAFSLG